jgi:hypothetical protein
MNVNPLATIFGAVADSGLVDRFVNLKNNLIYLASQDSTEVQAADVAASCSCSFSCDASSAIATLMGASEDGTGGVTTSELKDLLNTISTDVGTIKGDVATIQGDVDTIKATTGRIDTTLTTISSQLNQINANIDSMQHNYRVAHLYSLNNAYSNCLWKPQSEEIPYVKDYATVTGQFANVYTGYWDTAVSTLNNPNNSRTTRAQEILGYDIIVRSEGMVLSNVNVEIGDMSEASGLSGNNQSYALASGTNPTSAILMYFQEMIPETDICWIDAVTVLYKALGEEQISYQSFMSYDSAITPETSPAYNSLSNPVPDEKGNYAGYDFYMFLTRSNVISKAQAKSGEEIDEATIDYIYWQKAINAGFIPASYAEAAREPISFSNFFILASKMMQAYGEPVLGDDELKALLQVYGTNYPVQLGVTIADAWAYMAARGILDFNPTIEGQDSLLYDIVFSDYITRDQLLTMAMRIKDEDSRTSFKNIDIVLNLTDVMKEDYYYPVYDLNISNGEFQTAETYDHSQATTYEYLVLKTDKVNLGTIGLPTVYTEKTTQSAKILKGASVETTTVKTDDGKEWYSISVPIDYTETFYVAMQLAGGAQLQDNTVVFIEVPSSALGGGYFSKYSISGDTATVSPDSGYYLLFDDYMQTSTKLCTDYKRAGKEKPNSKAVSSNATVLEWLSAKVDSLTTPMVVQAATDVGETKAGTAQSFSVTYYTATAKVDSSDVSLITEKYEDDGSGTKVLTGGVKDYTLTSSTTLNYGDGAPFFNVTTTVDPDYYSGSVHYSSKQDIKLLNRLAALYEYEYEIWDTNVDDSDKVHLDISDLVKNTTSAGSVKENLASYINGSLESNVFRLNADVTDDNENGTLWSSLVGMSSRGFTVNTDKSNSNSMYNNKIEKLYDTFVTQFLFGLASDKYTCLPSAASPSSGSAITVNTEWNSSTYGTSVSEYKDYITSNYDKLFTDAQDTTITGLLEKGIYGAKQTKYTTYEIYGTQEGIDALKEKLTTIDNDGAFSEVIDDAISIDSNVATTAVMSRDQQILISWTDLCKSGYIVNTGSFAKPTMQSNGAYYFMTKEGQVIVNPYQYTIQIGTTLYDLMYSDGTGPTLVFIDTEQENEMYFDYRSVMGIVSTQFSRNDTKTETLQSHLGVGNCVVYDLDSAGITSEYFNTQDIRCYNYPDGVVSDGSSQTACTNYGYIINCITDTIWDTDYWDDTDSRNRLRLSTFVPTANYMVCIDDDGENINASLFIYYLRTAFEQGFVDENGTSCTVNPPNNVDSIYDDLENRVSKASISSSASSTSLMDALKSVYSVSEYGGWDELPWYLKMSCEAAADLYSYTGKYYLSSDYVIREFDITKQMYSNTTQWNTVDGDPETNIEIEATDAGAIYWLDGIGYVYNMPSSSEFTLQKYLDGEYLLPFALDESDSSNPKIISYNLNYYGMSRDDNQGVLDGDRLPFGVVLASDTNNYITLNGSKYSDYTSSVALNGDTEDTEVGSSFIMPFVLKSEAGSYSYCDGGASNSYAPPYFIAAPTAIYNQFGGNLSETMTMNNMTQYITDACKVYVGSTQIRLNSTNSQSTDKMFDYVSTIYNAMSIDGNTKAYRVARSSTQGDTIIVEPDGIVKDAGAGVGEVSIDDYYTNDLVNWLDGLGLTDLVNSIDKGASWLIIFAFKVLPFIGIIIMTILIGFSFIGDIKFVQTLFNKTIDPIRILTFGSRDINNWNWRNVLLPCTLLYLSFALFLNGNIIRLVMWGAKWYGVISKWAKML